MKFHDKEELELMKSIETEVWVSVNNLEEEIKKAKKAAEATLTKSERMNIRISPNDLRRLKIKAMEEGMPYQTLVSSIIHKYLIGRLQEQREQKDG
jgi:predicted DNA binding CopG/RHH family protein